MFPQDKAGHQPGQKRHEADEDKHIGKGQQSERLEETHRHDDGGPGSKRHGFGQVVLSPSQLGRMAIGQYAQDHNNDPRDRE